MRTIYYFVFLVITGSIQSTVWAELYKYTDEDGTVWMTDNKQDNYKAIRYLSAHNKPNRLKPNNSCVSEHSKKKKKRRARINPIINTYSHRYGVNPILIQAMVSIESCYDSNAVSRAGAQGLMQLMPDTAINLGVTDSFNIDQNLHAGIRYYSMLNKKFHYNSYHALAAYNAGPSTVTRYAGIPPYSETKNYVSKVIHKYKELTTTH